MPLEELEEEKEESAPQVNPPPYPENLVHPKRHTPEEDELHGELKNFCVKIPLLEAIKDVPIYNKIIKEECFKRPRRRRRDTPIKNVVGHLSNMMLGRVSPRSTWILVSQ